MKEGSSSSLKDIAPLRSVSAQLRPRLANLFRFSIWFYIYNIARPRRSNIYHSVCFFSIRYHRTYVWFSFQKAVSYTFREFFTHKLVSSEAFLLHGKNSILLDLLGFVLIGLRDIKSHQHSKELWRVQRRVFEKFLQKAPEVVQLSTFASVQQPTMLLTTFPR